jgi:hypothetical protein
MRQRTIAAPAVLPSAAAKCSSSPTHVHSWGFGGFLSPSRITPSPTDVVSLPLLPAPARLLHSHRPLSPPRSRHLLRRRDSAAPDSGARCGGLERLRLSRAPTTVGSRTAEGVQPSTLRYLLDPRHLLHLIGRLLRPSPPDPSTSDLPLTSTVPKSARGGLSLGDFGGFRWQCGEVGAAVELEADAP